jgi:hypothetical protein
VASRHRPRSVTSSAATMRASAAARPRPGARHSETRAHARLKSVSSHPVPDVPQRGYVSALLARPATWPTGSLGRRRYLGVEEGVFTDATEWCEGAHQAFPLESSRLGDTDGSDVARLDEGLQPGDSGLSENPIGNVRTASVVSPPLRPLGQDQYPMGRHRAGSYQRARARCALAPSVPGAGRRHGVGGRAARA